MIKKLHHIGIVVRDLDKAVDLYTGLLGVKPESFAEISGARIKIANFKIGETALEFLGPTPGNSVENFTQYRGEGLHHIAFEVDDIGEELKKQEKLGVKLVDREPHPGPDGDIAFIGPQGSHGVYIELIQPRKEGEK